MKQLLIAALALLPLFVQAQSANGGTEQQMQALGLTDLQSVDPSIRVELKLQTDDNVTGRALYTDLQHAYLHPQAALALKKAQTVLRRLRPELSLFVFDAARPMTVQAQLYAAVAGTDRNLFITNPKSGGDQHNYGLAVDVTLCNVETGDTLAMGTPYGALVDESSVGSEERLKAEGTLTEEMIANRELLRRVMAAGGFKALRTEWWHFNFRTRSEAKANFRMIK